MKVSKEIKVGFVAIFAIAMLVWGFNYLKGTNMFFKNTSVYAVYPKVPGLAVSSPIIINGVQSGVVDAIYFHPDKSSKVIVKLNITETALRIPKNSISELISTDFMGSKAIGLKLGDSDLNLEDGDTLQTEFEVSMLDGFSEQMLPIKDKAEQMMDTLMMTAASFTKLSEKFDRILDEKRQRDLQIAITSLHATITEFSALASDMRGMLRNDVKPVMRKYGELADSLKSIDISSTLTKANNALDGMAEVMGKMNEGEGTMGKLMNNDSLYNNLTGATKEMEELLEDIKLHPKRYFRVLSKKEIPYTPPK